MSETFEELVKNLERVYVRHTQDSIEINPEYIYMTIPADYVCTYHKILILLSEYGVDMLNDCQAGCSNQNKSIINCFNMFNAAVAARKLGQDKTAETIMKYVNGQLNIIHNYEEIDTKIVFPVDENGYLKAIISCGENPTFTIDPETGLLWEKSIANDNEVYALDEIDTDSK